MKRYVQSLICGLLIATLTACGTKPISSVSVSSSSQKPSSIVSATLNTAQTDALELEGGDFAEYDFVDDHIGEVVLNSCTDGDTANFRTLNGYNVSVRFLGIDTPESTAVIEPWGRAASEFTCRALKSAESIVLEGDAKNPIDTTGKRYLGWVWYKPIGSVKYRLLNLELVEQAYTKSMLPADAKYGSYFRAGEQNAAAAGKRVHGEKDPNFDYEQKGVPVTAYEVMHNYEEYMSKGVLVKLTGLSVAASAYSVYIRDLEPTILDDGTAHYFGTYIYGGHSSDLISIAKPGRIVSIYGMVNVFRDSPQISNPRTNNTGKNAYTIISKDNPIDTIKLDPSKDLSIYYGSVVQSEIIVKKIDKQARTIYGIIAGTDKVVSIFADANLYPSYNFDKIEIDRTYLVTAGFHPKWQDKSYLDPDYPEIDYDIKLINNANSDYHNFKLKEKE